MPGTFHGPSCLLVTGSLLPSLFLVLNWFLSQVDSSSRSRGRKGSEVRGLQLPVSLTSGCGLKIAFQLWGRPWHLPWQGALLMCVVSTVTRDHAEVCGMCWHQRSCGCPWGCAVARNHVEVYDVCSCRLWRARNLYFFIYVISYLNFFCSGIEDCRLTVKRDIEGFRDNLYTPPSPKEYQPRQEANEENS